jgi:CubicO group peptidase (beta-lactamase class C family)
MRTSTSTIVAALLAALAARSVTAQDLSAAHATFARGLIDAANGRDTSAIAALLSPRFPVADSARRAEAVRMLAGLAAQAKGLEIVKLDSVGNNTMVTVRAKAQPRLALVNLGWNRTDTDKLRYVELLKAWNPAADSVDWSPARSTREMLRRIDRNVDVLTRMGFYSGTVLIARGDSVLFARGYGWANLDDSVRNAVNTRYHTASMGKMFTAVAIGQLIEAGKLKMDDTLANVLPDYPNAERARQITVRQLLSHRAGLGDLWSHPSYGKGAPYRSNRDLAWAVASGPTLFPPGTRWSYSNEGFTVLGAIIEKLSGQSFEEYMRAHVWGPAKMTGVMPVGGDITVPHRALGYAPADDDLLAVEPLRPTIPSLGRTGGALGAGGEYASVTDFFRFVQALRHDRLLGRPMRDTLWVGRSQIPWDPNGQYASGFMRMNVAGHDYVGHGGGGGYGIDNMLYFSASGPWTIVVLGNFNPPGATDVAAAIAKFIATSGSTIALGENHKKP